MSTPTHHRYNAGDHVRIAEAPSGTPDAKGVVYYGFFRNLTGTVLKQYDDGTVSLSIDRDTLPEAVRQRHEAGENAQRDRWLNNLSDEERNRLTERERDFKLRYTLLVESKHLVPESAEPHSPAPARERKSSAEIDAAEAEHLRKLRPS